MNVAPDVRTRNALVAIKLIHKDVRVKFVKIG